MNPVDFWERDVAPALFARLDAAFPEFGWTRTGRGWTATNRDHTKARFDARPERVVCNRPGGLLVHGGSAMSWTAYVNNGTTPRGRDFVEAVKRLATLAGVDAAALDGEPTPEQEARERRRDALETFLGYAQDVLRTKPAGAVARAYLVEKRGYTETALEELPFGVYTTPADVKAHLEAAGVSAADVTASNLLVDGRWEGRLVIPWRDRWEHLATLAARDLAGTAEDKDKYLYLKGGRKPEAFGLDVALRSPEGRRNLVLVEGLLDVVALHYRGLPNVAALGGDGKLLTVDRWEALAEAGVRAVTLVLDNDEAGRAGLAAALDNVHKVHNVPNVPVVDVVNPADLEDCKDPDELVRRRGLDAFRALLDARQPGAVYRGAVLLADVTPTSPASRRREAVDAVLAYEATFRGPRAGLDREDLLCLLAEKTGYSAAGLADMAETLEAKRQKEDTEKALDAALRRAQDRGDRSAVEVVRDLSAALVTLQVRTVDAPPPFDVDRLDAETRAAPEGLSSGWAALDRLEVRFNAGELAVLGARTGHAKTTALVGLLRNWLREDGDALFVFYSSEEAEVRVYHRLLALLTAEAGSGWTANDARDYLRNAAGRDSWRSNPEPLAAARETLRALEDRLLVVHRPSWSVDDITAHARTLAERGPVGAVLVDYLQRIPPPAGSHERRDIELSATARALRTLALSAAVPVVVGAQISREAVRGADVAAGNYEDKKVQDSIRDRRPQLHHLREGGSEQEADLVLGLLNYRADFEHDEAAPGAVPNVTRLDVGLLKSRYGPGQTWAELAYEARYGLIRDPAFEGEV